MDGLSYKVIQLTKEHLNELIHLEKACFTRAWSQEQFLHALESEQYIFLGIIIDNLLVSYISVQCIPSISDMKDGECEVLNIASYEQHRRKGYAESILKYILDFGKKNLVQSFFLEVRESNTPAKQLYLKLGFKEIGRRKNYYTTEQGQEDALIMEYKVIDRVN